MEYNWKNNIDTEYDDEDMAEAWGISLEEYLEYKAEVNREDNEH